MLTCGQLWYNLVTNRFGLMHVTLAIKEYVSRMARRKLSRNEKIFYVISLLIIFSMVFGTFASLFATPF